MKEPLSVEMLTLLLKEAEKSHAEYEKELGKRDENWQEWYARYVLDALHSSE